MRYLACRAYLLDLLDGDAAGLTAVRAAAVAEPQHDDDVEVLRRRVDDLRAVLQRVSTAGVNGHHLRAVTVTVTVAEGVS